MKVMNRMLVAMCVLFVLGSNAMSSESEEESIGFEVTADYFGKYLWRGQTLNDDPVFQPGLSMAYGGLSAGIWGSMELTDIYGTKDEFTEIDLYADYSADVPGVEGLGFSVGFVYYDFPNTTFTETTELYWGFGLDTILSPSVTVSHDIDSADGGIYISAGIGHTIELGEDSPVAIDLGASYGWGNKEYNNYYWGVDKDLSNDLSFSAAMPIDIDGWCITPSVNYTVLIDSDIKHTDMFSADDEEFFFGIGLSKAF